MSHTKEKLTENKAIRQRMLKLLNVNQEWLSQLIYEYGLAYIHDVLKLRGAQRKQAESCKTYWDWWLNEWANRDFELNKQVQIDFYGTMEINVKELKKAEFPTIMPCVYFSDHEEFQRFYSTFHFYRNIPAIQEKEVLEDIEKAIK